MATCKKIQPPAPEPTYTLELTEQEAKDLYETINKGPGSYVVYDALKRAGFGLKGTAGPDYFSPQGISLLSSTLRGGYRFG